MDGWMSKVLKEKSVHKMPPKDGHRNVFGDMHRKGEKNSFLTLRSERKRKASL